ncbi:MAG: general secretion pathway protein GspE [Deltaproteobacteria bacterium HGW-Deltaproteobacteria-2]|jgi:type IV pilus assembly protein PilB|nr:MAG: general secretion pathway protein GspE [Deltaproteobacteria bacterium HGW-Deltaproteobacteria-2]
MKNKKRLGEILVKSGLLTEEKLEQALENKKKTDLKLGQYLIRQGLVQEKQIIDLISDQLNIRKYQLNDFPLDLELIRYIPIEIAQKNQVVPLKLKGKLLTIAIVDPLDIQILDSLEKLTNLEVEPVICTEVEINQLINSMYGMQSDLGNIMGTMEIDSRDEEEEPPENKEEIQIASLQDMAGEALVIRLTNSIFAQAIRDNASDIHISPQQNTVQLRYRIDGKLIEMPSPPKSIFLSIIARVKIIANMDITISRVPQDGRFTLKIEKKEINVRVSSIPTIYGENIVMRLLDMGAGFYTLDRLGMTDEDKAKIEVMANKPYGMILSTGPTGSGKSTSLYAILSSINKPDINIITLEDPVEYRINDIRQVQLNRKAGMTFAGGLRSILRQDPDVIMVGEIRDAETAAVAVQAAQTGHRVLSTVHTNDAAGVITRFIDMGIEPFLVSSVLIVSFAQRLVRTICPYCKESYNPPASALAAFGITPEQAANANFQRGRGCNNCRNTGYKGRTGVFEVLVNDEMIQDMIIKQRPSQEISRAAVAAGKLKTLRDDSAQKVMQGITTLEEAASAVMS